MSSMWQVTDGLTTWDCVDANVVKTLDGLNSATVVLVGDITMDTVVDVLYNSTIVLRGYIKNKTLTTEGLYRYEVVELAIELENMAVTDDSGKYTFMITNATVDDVVDHILYGTGWGRGSSDTTLLGAVSFAYTRVLPALFKVLKELRGHKVWFDDVDKTIYFGAYRANEGVLTYFSKSEEKSTRNRNIEKVIVFSNDESVYAEYGTGSKVAVYKYTSAKTHEECAYVAETIYNELNSEYHRIEVKTKIDPNIDEGDLVTVDSHEYLVYRVEYDMYTMTVHLNDNINSIFDILGTKLMELTGTMSISSKQVSEIYMVGKVISNIYTSGGGDDVE